MSRITVEDCLEKVNNRFELVMLASKRARQLYKGAKPLIDADNREVVVALREIADGKVRKLAASVDGVVEIEKCRVRKSGLHLALDIHVVVDGDLSVRRGHAIAHEVEAKLRASQHRINDVTVHIEPDRR